ncbi:Stk1 family PASTA domain-containing Ser/Thr kinase [Rhodococcus sp. UNC363MFTsu5.1]|uniref:Stk1 family PASTA domain-containing Ser/Thr kinase n=1 Tax=Rhodococcus sp. UNC363MFTsu5.1 TaxID=1449069 RepID=UPI00048767FD|nr:Stk1 family PASTA domain-containing Ser/Thr kinase [Rhodococcus sp. UNC363MFTsu5.1]
MGPGDQALIGTLLDRRYRVDSPIARGGMSMVYRGLDMRLDRPVAIKVMDPKFAHDPQFVARFEFEARAVARLTHPGLVAVYDQGIDGEHAFLVMELVAGGTLRELLRERGPMPPHAAAAVTGPVLDALAVAHRAGLVHRDIKPENVLISDSGEVKIADFGLVRAVAGSNATSSSVILGTAAYLSPEQVTTGNADARSDVYATGVLLYEMLTGRTPFTGDTSLSIAYQRINADVPSPGSQIAGVPQEFDQLVLEATARDPEERFTNAGEMAAALRSVSHQLQLPAYRVPAPRRSAQHLSAAMQVAGALPPPATATAGRDDATTALASAAPTAVHPGIQHAGPQPTKVVTDLTARPPEFPQPDLDPAATRQHRRDPAQYEFPDFAAERQRSRRTIMVWLLVILLLGVAVGFGGWWMGSGRYAAVPSIDGLDRASATSTIEAAGLSTEIRGEYSNSAPVDTLLGTDPAAGSRVPKESVVALLVSLGRPAVPELPAGGDPDQVERVLRERTFVPVEGGEAFSTKVPNGGVAALKPGPGTVLDVGSQVQMIRSKGSPPVRMPDVRGKSADEARAALDAVGITVGETREEFDSGVDGGDVIGTDPSTGTEVGAGSSVTLIVSTAVRLPSMLGRTVGSAREELTGLGMVPQIRQVTDSDRSLVLTQSPGPGTRVEAGTTVSLVAVP